MGQFERTMRKHDGSRVRQAMRPMGKDPHKCRESLTFQRPC